MRPTGTSPPSTITSVASFRCSSFGRRLPGDVVPSRRSATAQRAPRNVEALPDLECVGRLAYRGQARRGLEGPHIHERRRNQSRRPAGCADPAASKADDRPALDHLRRLAAGKHDLRLGREGVRRTPLQWSQTLGSPATTRDRASSSMPRTFRRASCSGCHVHTLPTTRSGVGSSRRCPFLTPCARRVRSLRSVRDRAGGRASRSKRIDPTGEAR
jgi:hypothetical protein